LKCILFVVTDNVPFYRSFKVSNEVPAAIANEEELVDLAVG